MFDVELFGTSHLTRNLFLFKQISYGGAQKAFEKLSRSSSLKTRRFII